MVTYRAMARGVLGILGGLVAWQVGFFILAWILARLWPDYAVAGRNYFTTGAYSFAVAMAVCNIVFWIVTEIAAGWIATRIAKRREAGWVLAAMLLVYMCAIHLYFYWATFPWWYNISVVVTVAPAVLLGGTLAERHFALA
jgi:uncharacterized membrane protein YeaQ/YmgE (transglycosylase-associated protein family)